MVSPSVSIDEVLMKKTSLILVVLLWAVCSGFAATDKYFCRTDNYYVNQFTIVQVSADSVGEDSEDPTIIRMLDAWGDLNNGTICYESWDKLRSGILQAIDYAVEDGYGYFYIYLGSDLDFGGLNSNGTSCKNDFKPLPLGDARVGVSFSGYSDDGGNYAIKNFCYVADALDREFTAAGFFSTIAHESSVHNVTFENPYVRVKNLGTTVWNYPVGVVAGSVEGYNYDEFVSGITIKNGTVIGATAGGFVGQVMGSSAYLSMRDLSADGLKVYMTSDVFASGLSRDNPASLSPALGGIAGTFDGSFDYVSSATNESSDDVMTIGIRGLDVQNKMTNAEEIPAMGNVSVGGLFGVVKLGEGDKIQSFYVHGNVSSVSAIDMVGYVAGALYVPDATENYVKSGYYYGSTANAPHMVGMLDVSGSQQADIEEYLKSNDEYAVCRYVYRNAVGSLVATGSLQKDGYLLDAETGSPNNTFGTLPESDMKSPKLAYVLGQTGANSFTWGADMADALPDFVMGDDEASYLVTFRGSTDNSYYESMPAAYRDLIDRLALRDGPNFIIELFTDYSGKLAYSFVDSLASIPGLTWYDADNARSFISSQAFDGDATYFLNIKRSIVVAPRVLATGSSEITSRNDMQAIAPGALEDYTGYYALKPDLQAELVSETGDYVELVNYTSPEIYFWNGMQLASGNATYLATEMEGVMYSKELLGNLKEAFAEMTDGASMSSVGDTLYVVYEAVRGYSSVTAVQSSIEGATLDVLPLGYRADDTKIIEPMGAKVYVAVDPYMYGPTGESIVSAHAYVIEGGANKGYSLTDDSLSIDISIVALSSGSTAPDEYPSASKAAKGTAFGTVQNVLKCLSGLSRTWHLTLTSGDTLVMDTVFAAIADYKKTHDWPEPQITITVSPKVEAIHYTLKFDRMVDKKPFYGNGWDVWSGLREMSLDDWNPDFPGMYIPDEYGNYVYYNMWRPENAGEGERFTTFDEYLVDFLDPKVVNKMTPLMGEGYDVYYTNVWMYRNEAGQVSDDKATIELWQIIGDDESGIDTVAHEFVEDAAGGDGELVQVPLITDGYMYFNVGVVSAEGYILDSLNVWKSYDGGETYELYSTLWNHDKLFVEDVPMKLEPFFRENRTYYLTYDVNVDDDVILYSSEMSGDFLATFTTDDVEIDLPFILRSDACFMGWGYDSDAGSDEIRMVDDGYDIPLEGVWSLDFRMVESDGRNDSLDMYVVWGSAKEKECEPNNRAIKFLDDSTGTVTLTQTIAGRDYVTKVDGAGALVPNSEEYMHFVVGFIPAEGYVAADSITVVAGAGRGHHDVAGGDFGGEKKTWKVKIGDTLALGYGEVSFTGGFKKAPVPDPLTTDSLPRFSDSTMLFVSGNAYQFRYVIENCGEEQDVRFDMALMADGDSDKVEMTLGAEEACSGTIEDYPLLSGSYTLKAEVYVEGHKDSASVFTQTFTVESVIASAGVDSWQMLGLDAVEVDSVVMDDDVRFFWWNESKSYGEFWQYYSLTDLTQFERGRGYWYSSLEGRTLPLKDSIEIPKDGFKLAWSLDSLYSGWNLVSNPFGWEISLGVSDDDEVTFWRWNAETSEYERATTVRPYEALWAKVAKHVDWTLDTKPVFVAQDSVQDSLQKSLSKATTEKEWSIRAVLSDHNGKRDSWNVLGVGARNVAWEEPPAGMGNHVNLSIMDGKRSLAKSVKTANASKVTAADNAYEWQVELSASTARMGYLSFEGLDAIGKLGYRVFVTVDGFTQEVAAGSAVEVPLTSLAKTATVRVAAEPRKTLTYALGGLRMVQSGSLLNVTFMASDGLAGSGLTVEVLDLKGKVAARTVGNAVSGANSATLTAPAGGLYMLRVRAGSAQTSGKIVVK